MEILALLISTSYAIVSNEHCVQYNSSDENSLSDASGSVEQS
jgi:hypothetical protein